MNSENNFSFYEISEQYKIFIGATTLNPTIQKMQPKSDETQWWIFLGDIEGFV